MGFSRIEPFSSHSVVLTFFAIAFQKCDLAVNEVINTS